MYRRDSLGQEGGCELYLGRSAHWCTEDGQIEAFVVVITNLESQECEMGGMYESED